MVSTPVASLSMASVVASLRRTRRRSVTGCENFTAHVIIMAHPGHSRKGDTPILDCHTSHIACKVDKLLQKHDRRTGNGLEAELEHIKNGDSALVLIVPTKPLCIDVFVM